MLIVILVINIILYMKVHVLAFVSQRLKTILYFFQNTW